MLDEIRTRLLDKESEYIYDLRCRYSHNHDAETFVSDIFSYYDDWLGKDYTFDLLKIKDVVICGAGRWGKKLLDIFRNHRIEPVCMTDNRNVEIKDMDVCKILEACRRYPEAFFIIPTSYIPYRIEIKNELLDAGINDENIIIPQCCANAISGNLYFNRGFQYFDVLSPEEDEIFLDCGALDGNTIRDCFIWGGKKIRKVISFEAIDSFYYEVSKRYEEDPRVRVYNYAVWDKNEILTFTESGGGSRVDNDGNIRVQAKPLDELLIDENVTFIKMDIEGAELNALKGAEQILKQYKPKLAISVYHKPDDIWTIPEYLLSVVPEYKFYMRHYASDECETILYAKVF